MLPRPDKAASHVLATHWSNEVPVDPFKIAKKLGFDTYLNRDDMAYGFSVDKDDRGVVIYVQEGTPLEMRQHCAEAIGAIVCGAKDYRYSREFALCLLIPDRQLGLLQDKKAAAKLLQVSDEYIESRVDLRPYTVA